MDRDKARGTAGKEAMSMLKRMEEYLVGAQGAPYEACASEQVKPIATAFLTSALLPSIPSISLRNSQELKTLGATIDLLVQRKPAQAADIILARRWQAVETAVITGSWNTARHLELVDSSPLITVPPKLRRKAVREEIADMKYRRDIQTAQKSTQRPGIQC